EPEIGNAVTDPLEQLRVSANERIVVRRACVPMVRAASFEKRDGMFHEGNAATLDRSRDENLRDARRRVPHCGERSSELIVVMPVARFDVPAERPQLRLEIAEGEDLFRRLVRLELVAVDVR